MKIALAMIVKGSNSEAAILARCLDNVTSVPAIDGIFITRTHLPGEEPNVQVKKVAEDYGATVSEFEWQYDFAAARNFNFSQVPKDYDYILWCDADDMWRNLEKLKPTIEEHPSIDAFGFWYLYDWDEFKKPTVVHRKTMLIKNDGCAVWKGKLHEDLDETRSLEVFLIEGIERLHMTTHERAAIAAKRNIEISQREVDEKPNDPRSYWNLANSQFSVSDFAAAKDTFEKFLKDSQSDEERYLAHERLADCYKAMEMRDDAIRHLQIAIGLRPILPDAYLQLAFLFYQYGNLDKAEEYCLNGLLRKPQPNRMIVYNPRDYDYNPMMLLSRIYYDRNRPDLMLPLLKGCLKIYPEDEHLKKLVKEGTEERDALGKALEQVQKLEGEKDMGKLRKALEKLPENVKSHPAVCALRNSRFVKTESSGNELVIYCGQTVHQWNPELFEQKGFGGSEEAVIHMAREFAKLGWFVTVYNNCGHKPMVEAGGSVVYRPFWEFNYRDKVDAMILWRWVKPLDAPLNCDKVFVDLHDVMPAGEFTEKRLQKVSKIFVKTNFHRSLFPNVPDEKIAVIPNGMASYVNPKTKRDPMLVINTSSPDRSLDVLPELWKRVKEKVPKAKLQWCYGWDNFKVGHAEDSKKIDWMNQTIKAMDDAGIESLGRLTQKEVGELYGKASFFAYPTEFAEIDCISVKKAQAAKCLPVTTDFGALDESNVFGLKSHSTKTKDTWNKPYQFHFGVEGKEAQDQWVHYMVEALTHGMESDWKGLEAWVEGFEWSAIAKRWQGIIKGN